jgi:K(+)-stimulated pyrophosphate-energized sodium pump
MLDILNYSYLFGLLGLVVVAILYFYVSSQDGGNEKMRDIGDAIHEGAMAFLKKEYAFILVFVAVAFTLLISFINTNTAIAFLAGAGFSMLAGFVGMKAATKSNTRTAQAANTSGVDKALFVAFAGGSVMCSICKNWWRNIHKSC